MGQSRRSQLSLGVFVVFCILLQSSLANNEDNKDQPTIDNETVPREPVKELVPDPIAVKPPGSTEELRPNLVGLANMAIVHLPRSLTFQYVIQATREIIDGVRYELMVNAKNLNKEEVICRLVILEKPWITTESGDKYRSLTYTNCTVAESDTFDPSKYDGNTIFNSSNTEVTQGDLSDLEKQIMGGKERKPTPAPDDTTDTTNDADIALGIIRGIESQIVPERTTTLAPSLSEGSLSLLGSLFGMDTHPPEGTSSAIPSELNGNVDSGPCSNNPLPTPLTEIDSNPQNPDQQQDPQLSQMHTAGYLPPEGPRAPEMSDGSLSLLDSLFMQPVVEPEHVVVRVTPSPSPITLEANVEVSADGGEPVSGVPDYESSDVQRTEQLTEPVVNTEIDGRVQSERQPVPDDSQAQQPLQSDDAQVQIEIAYDPILSDLQRNVPTFYEVVADSDASLCALNEFGSGGQVRVGGPRWIPKEQYGELQTQFTQSLSTLKGSKDQITGIDKIYCATTQVVAGSLKKISGSFLTADGQTKNCIVEIWSRPWIPDGTQVTINCNPDEQSKSRNRREANAGQALFERVKEMLPYEAVEKARGEPLFTKINTLYNYLDEKFNNNQKYVFNGLFELPDGSEEVCSLSLLQQSNRLNILTFNCDDSIDYVYSFYPSVLHIPHNKRTKEQRLFAKFMHNYNRHYARTFAEEERFQIFSDSLKKIKMLNENEEGSAKYGVTEFADMTAEEYAKRTGLRYEDYLAESNHIRNPVAEIPNVELPKSFDWRDKGAVTQVKDQGACGSCWAFSVTGNIEGLHAAKTGQLEEYSEQELVDCDTIDSACSGGLPDNAYKAIEEIGGLELESEYPYKARKEKCSFNKTMSHVRVKGAVDLPKNETALALWLVSNGPISIGINANAMQFYRAGISHPWKILCRKSNLDHGVLIVGFGIADYPVFNKTLPYWIVKNSWGKSWGEQGYYRVFRGDNTCGVSEMASSAVLAD